MLKPLEVFENEEAEKLLDYFVAYKKLNEIADFFRCAAKVNSELSLHEINFQPTETAITINEQIISNEKCSDEQTLSTTDALK